MLRALRLPIIAHCHAANRFRACAAISRIAGSQVAPQPCTMRFNMRQMNTDSSKVRLGPLRCALKPYSHSLRGTRECTPNVREYVKILFVTQTLFVAQPMTWKTVLITSVFGAGLVLAYRYVRELGREKGTNLFIPTKSEFSLKPQPASSIARQLVARCWAGLSPGSSTKTGK